MDKLLDRNHWKKMLPFIQAFTEGKEIEMRICRKWVSLSFPSFDDPNTEDYRIKPEPKYVPFTFSSACKYGEYGLIGKTLKHKCVNHIAVIVTVSLDGVRIGHDWRTYKELFSNYEFEDGTPCGTLED